MNSIDPLKDFSITLLSKIKNLITVKGIDLMQIFVELDKNKSGECNYDGLREALKSFGLTNLKNYHMLTLYKIYKNKYETPVDATKSKGTKRSAQPPSLRSTLQPQQQTGTRNTNMTSTITSTEAFLQIIGKDSS